MKYKIFTYPVPPPETPEDLNGFLSSRRVVSVQSHIVVKNQIPYLIFIVEYIEITPEESVLWRKYKISAISARHTETTKPQALKIETDSKTLAYTGDGELTEALIDFSAEADLLIAECYYFDKPIKWHLNYPDIKNLKPKKIVLTHMHENMLAHKDEIPETCAYDGLEIKI